MSGPESPATFGDGMATTVPITPLPTTRSMKNVNNCIDCSAIVNYQLSALELAITPDMGHDGWPNVITLSNIHERFLFTLHFHLYKNTEVSMETP